MRRAFSKAIGPLLIAGCSVLAPAPAELPALHAIDARPTTGAVARRDLVLAVSAPRAAPGYDSSAMVYVRQAHTLDHYATHRWVDPPARLFGQLLVRTLEDSGGFRAVVSAGGGLPADMRLDTEIVVLRQNFLVRPSRAEFTLRAQLVDVPGRRVLITRYLEVTQEAPSDDAAGGVAAANAAVARALAQVAALCVDAAAEPAARASPVQGTAGAPARP